MVQLQSVRSRMLRKPTLGNSLVVMLSCVTVATLARWLLGAAANPVPFVTYFPAIVVCALLAGWRAGMASILASITVVNFLFLKPTMTITADWQAIAMMVLFVLSCGLLVAIAQTLRTTVTRLQAATERAEYLNQELLHRVRNSLTVVNSLASLTYQADPANFIAVFSKRMSALAGGLEILSQQERQQCDFHEAINRACLPFRDGDRIALCGVSGPLPHQACVPLMLAIHELCTNAVKYGALSSDVGTVRIDTNWDIAQCEAQLVWQETGGPKVAPPDREGLGTALLADPVLGPASLAFNPQGLRCEMHLAGAC